MGKLSDLIQKDQRPGVATCSVALLLRTLPKAEAADLRAAVADAAVTGAAISRALTAFGHRVTTNTVNRHRRGECGCGQAS